MSGCIHRFVEGRLQSKRHAGSIREIVLFMAGQCKAWPTRPFHNYLGWTSSAVLLHAASVASDKSLQVEIGFSHRAGNPCLGRQYRKIAKYAGQSLRMTSR